MQETASIIVRVERARQSTADIKRFRDEAARADSTVSSLSKRIKTLGLSLAGGGAAIVAMASSSAKTAKEIKNLSNISGLLASEFQRGAFAAKTAGVSTEKYADILKDVNDKVGDFLQNGAGPLKDFFVNIAPKVGLTAKSFKDLSSKDALQLYVSSIEKANLSQSEMTFYMEAIANDATVLLPLLRDNGKAMERLSKDADNLGIVLSDIDIRNLEEMRASTARATAVMGSLKDRLSAELAPALTSIAERSINVAKALSSIKYEDIARALEITADAAKLLAVVYVTRLTPSILSKVNAKRLAIVETMRYQAALARMTGVSRGAAIGIASVGTAARGATAAMALIGGPVGAAVVAGTALYFFAQNANSADKKLEKLSPNIRQLTKDFNGLTEAGINKAISDARIELTRLNNEVQAQSESFKNKGRSGRAKIKSIQNGYKDEIKAANDIIKSGEQQLKEIKNQKIEMDKIMSSTSSFKSAAGSETPQDSKIIDLAQARAQIQSLKDGLLEGEQAIKNSHTRRIEAYKAQFEGETKLQDDHRKASEAVRDAELADYEKSQEEKRAAAKQAIQDRINDIASGSKAEMAAASLALLEQNGLEEEAIKLKHQRIDELNAEQLKKEEIRLEEERNKGLLKEDEHQQELVKLKKAYGEKAQVNEALRRQALSSQRANDAADEQAMLNGRLSAMQGFYGNLSVLAGKNSKKGKALAAAQGAIAAIQTGINVTKTASEYLPAPIPAIMGAAAVAAQMAQVSRIKSQNSAGSFEHGGIVGGNSYTGDKLTANVNSGEMIINRKQQKRLFEQSNGKISSGDINLTVINNGQPARVESVRRSGQDIKIVLEAVKNEMAKDMAANTGFTDILGQRFTRSA